MGPSVKFVSCINGSFSKKKIRGHFFIRKNTKPGVVEGGLANHQTFYLIFFVKPSLKDTTFAIFLKSIRVIDIKYDIHVYSRMSIIIIMDVNHNHHIITNTK